MSVSTESDSARPSNLAAPKLGIIGDGQLARMTAMAALQLGVEVVVLARTRNSPATQVAPECLVGDWNDPKTLLEFAGSCSAITLENEFVDAGALELLEQSGHTVFPNAACVSITRDKLKQKSALRQAGIPVPEFLPVETFEELVLAGNTLGWPLMLKARCNGYDGRGNFLVRSAAEAEAGWEALNGGENPLMAEALFPFERELAVIVTRAKDGATAIYPVVETRQSNHVCHTVKAPAQAAAAVAERAAEMAHRAVEVVGGVGGVGSFGVELFLSKDGQLAINELAPRVHNSGHYTIEACACSQFENHVRAVLGWPLGDPGLIVPAAAMVNLLGTGADPVFPRALGAALGVPGAKVHLYGKTTSSPGRKMGHVTMTGPSPEQALAGAERAALLFNFGTSV